ncbi:hypothetical protein RJ639_010475 [Escallonia herrerae]|uniref:CCHC-type domain-containing protein n=1 Tax=Escallonia herrerae TaxID=1293975 RepID=A0AA88VN17_9ASTE|nr:hypothetical protein RJ639_010475 [Escallonia herrerae]
MVEEGKGKIEKFNDMNFQWWKMQVKDYLYQKDLYLSLVGEKPEAMNASEWAILDRKALATVRLSLTPQVAFNISKEKTTATVMKALEKLYEKPSVSNKNNLMTTVSNSTISGTLTLNDVVSSVMNDEMLRKTIDDGISSSTDLSVESSGRQNNKGRSPTRRRSRSRGKSKSKGKTIVCWNCNKEGHKKNDCMEPKKKKGAGGRQGDDKGANMGKVKIKLSNGGTLVLKDARHIPELQKNLTSVSGLDREGYFVAFGEKQWKVIKGSMVVARDDASRKTWIYAIRQKSNIYHTFKKWKALVENETGNKIKCLKSDNEGEYHDGGFQEYCSNNDIRLIRTVKRTSQENGDENGYRLWDYEHNKIIRSRDVIFDESRLYKHRLQEHGIKKDNKEYMELIEPEDGQVPRTENPEVLDETTDTEIGAGDQQQVPETLNLRRSSRVRKAPDRLCLPLNYILYTDSNDMLVADSSMGRINELKKKLASTFSMKDLGEAKQLLGMRITRDRKQKKLWLSQEEYIDKKIITLSTTEAEYVAVTEASKEIIWLQRLLTELGYGQVDCNLWTNIYSAIHLAKNSAFHSRTKHVQFRYHFIRSLLEDGQLNLENIEGNKNPADMLTKVVERQKAQLLISLR